jgi:hypothetical protein
MQLPVSTSQLVPAGQVPQLEGGGAQPPLRGTHTLTWVPLNEAALWQSSLAEQSAACEQSFPQ